MNPSDAEELDFKPFFDMVVGVLFILLILIAAQMFFSQWGGSPESSAREREQRRALEWKRQISDFLTVLADRLQQRGIAVALNLSDRSLTVPLESMLATNPEGHPSPTRLVPVLGETLTERLQCLPGQRKSVGPQDCSPADLLKLGQIETELRIAAIPANTRLVPDRYGRLVAILLHSAVVQGAPDLLSFSGAGGLAALQPTTPVSAGPALPANPKLTGDFTIRFVFDPHSG